MRAYLSFYYQPFLLLAIPRALKLPLEIIIEEMSRKALRLRERTYLPYLGR